MTRVCGLTLLYVPTAGGHQQRAAQRAEREADGPGVRAGEQAEQDAQPPPDGRLCMNVKRCGGCDY